MTKDTIDMLYKAFLTSTIIRCEITEDEWEIVYVEDRLYKTDLLIRFTDGQADVRVSQEAPRYPVYDSKGNVINFGV